MGQVSSWTIEPAEEEEEEDPVFMQNYQNEWSM
jgi:hypothetical protein